MRLLYTPYAAYKHSYTYVCKFFQFTKILLLVVVYCLQLVLISQFFVCLPQHTQCCSLQNAMTMIKAAKDTRHNLAIGSQNIRGSSCYIYFLPLYFFFIIIISFNDSRSKHMNVHFCCNDTLNKIVILRSYYIIIA